MFCMKSCGTGTIYYVDCGGEKYKDHIIDYIHIIWFCAMENKISLQMYFFNTDKLNNNIIYIIYVVFI